MGILTNGVSLVTSQPSELKFRFSYGLVGNDDNGSRFLYQSQWTTGWKTYTFGHTGNGLNLGGAEFIQQAMKVSLGKKQRN